MISTLVMVGALLASAPTDAQSLLNERLGHFLNGQNLKAEEVKEGTKIPLRSFAGSALAPFFGSARRGSRN
ncbi:MAG: hypothetical protein ACREI3_01640 [Nitrospirales bacterium]